MLLDSSVNPGNTPKRKLIVRKNTPSFVAQRIVMKIAVVFPLFLQQGGLIKYELTFCYHRTRGLVASSKNILKFCLRSPRGMSSNCCTAAEIFKIFFCLAHGTGFVNMGYGVRRQTSTRET